MADSRGVFDLGVEMPDVLVLDTSAISVMLFEDQETHPDYTAFLARVVAENTVPVLLRTAGFGSRPGVHEGGDAACIAAAATAVLHAAPLLCADTGFAHLPEGLLMLITDSGRATKCRAIRAGATGPV